MSLKDQILAANDMPSEPVTVPEWGVTVQMRTLSAYERDAFSQATVNGKKMDLSNVRARFVALCMTDDTGARVFSDTEADALGSKSTRIVERLWKVASRLNGMGEDEAEDLAKNSGTGLSAG